MKNEILNTVDWDILNKYVEDELITAKKHPQYDLWLLTYTHHVKLQNKWDLYTRSCRGLVVDSTGKIIARPFQKFKEIDGLDISNIDMSLDFEIFEKMDGSLAIVFYYDVENKWIVTTKGGFGSEQAKEADNMLKNRYQHMNQSKTYLFEIIYPQNRIIVDYGDTRDMILLSVIDNKTGKETSYKLMNEIYHNYFSIVKKYVINNLSNLYDLKALEIENREGFVIKFYNGYRVKVKFKRYDIMHRIMKHISPQLIWQSLKATDSVNSAVNKIPKELLDVAPFEFFKWIKETENELRVQSLTIANDILKEYNEIYNPIRKIFAALALESKNSDILFKLYDGYTKKCNDLIWDQIKPAKIVTNY